MILVFGFGEIMYQIILILVLIESSQLVKVWHYDLEELRINLKFFDEVTERHHVILVVIHQKDPGSAIANLIISSYLFFVDIEMK